MSVYVWLFKLFYTYIYLFWFVEPDPDSRILGGSRIGFLQYFGFYSVERIATRLKRVYSRDFEISFVKSRKRQLCRISAIDIIRSSSHEITMLEILKKVEIKQNRAFPFSAFLHFIFAHAHAHRFSKRAIKMRYPHIHKKYWLSHNPLYKTKRIWNVWNKRRNI